MEDPRRQQDEDYHKDLKHVTKISCVGHMHSRQLCGSDTQSSAVWVTYTVVSNVLSDNFLQ